MKSVKNRSILIALLPGDSRISSIDRSLHKIDVISFNMYDTVCTCAGP